MTRVPFLLIATICILQQATAQPRVSVKINAATVFLNGAELNSTASVTLPKGESDVLFTNVAGNANAQSLNIGAENGIVVQSATFQNNYLGDTALSLRARSLRDSISILERDMALVEEKKTVITEEINILNENRKVCGEHTGLDVSQLQKLLDLYSVRMSALLAAQRELNNKNEGKEARLALLRRQIEEEQKKNYTPGGQLLVKFYAPQAGSSQVTMSYVVPNAGWTPSYDLRVEKVGDPVKLFYKASVYQNCGVKWEGVRLTLSTGNPNEGVEAPELSPRYLTFYQPWPHNESLGYANKNQGEFLGNFKRGKGDAMGVAGGLNSEPVHMNLPAPTTLNNYTAVDNSGIATTFDIDLPYSIPTDGQQHTVAIKTYELPAIYRYFAVPRLDKDAFLQAQVTNWEELNLLPATTNVFFEGSYVGQGYIDMRNVKDTMNFSLGRDKKIVIRRERNKDVHSQKYIGTNERQRFDYTITVRNTRKEIVHLVVLDQLPLSKEGDIVIEDINTPDAEYTAETGAVKWTIDVKPQESHKLEIGYTIKYPKGKTVTGMN